MHFAPNFRSATCVFLTACFNPGQSTGNGTRISDAKYIGRHRRISARLWPPGGQGLPSSTRCNDVHAARKAESKGVPAPPRVVGFTVYDAHRRGAADAAPPTPLGASHLWAVADGRASRRRDRWIIRHSGGFCLCVPALFPIETLGGGVVSDEPASLDANRGRHAPSCHDGSGGAWRQRVAPARQQPFNALKEEV